MLEIIINISMCVLAFYGLFCLFLNSFEIFRGYRKRNEQGVPMVIYVKNRENDIERLVRDIMYLRSIWSIIKDKSIYFIDMDSNDNTLIILKKLQHHYNYYFEVVEQNQWERVYEKTVL